MLLPAVELSSDCYLNAYEEVSDYVFEDLFPHMCRALRRGTVLPVDRLALLVSVMCSVGFDVYMVHHILPKHKPQTSVSAAFSGF